jgi:WD40 repeat protein
MVDLNPLPEMLTIFLFPPSYRSKIPSTHSRFHFSVTASDDPLSVIQHHYHLAIFILEDDDSSAIFSTIDFRCLPSRVCLAVRSGELPRNSLFIPQLHDFSGQIDQPLATQFPSFIEPFFKTPVSPTYSCDFQPDDIENVIAASDNGYTFLLTETAIAIIHRSGDFSWFSLQFLIHRPNFFKANCDGTFLAIAMRYGAFLIALNPPLHNFQFIQIQFSDHSKYAAIEFHSHHPHYFAVAFTDGVIRLCHISTSNAIKVIDKRETNFERIAAIRFLPPEPEAPPRVEGTLFCAGDDEIIKISIDENGIFKEMDGFLDKLKEPLFSIDFLKKPQRMIVSAFTGVDLTKGVLYSVDLETKLKTMIEKTAEPLLLRRVPWLYAYSKQSVSIVYTSIMENATVRDELIRAPGIIGCGGERPFAILVPGFRIDLCRFPEAAAKGLVRVDPNKRFRLTDVQESLQKMNEWAHSRMWKPDEKSGWQELGNELCNQKQKELEENKRRMEREREELVQEENNMKMRFKVVLEERQKLNRRARELLKRFGIGE